MLKTVPLSRLGAFKEYMRKAIIAHVEQHYFKDDSIVDHLNISHASLVEIMVNRITEDVDTEIRSYLQDWAGIHACDERCPSGDAEQLLTPPSNDPNTTDTGNHAV